MDFVSILWACHNWTTLHIENVLTCPSQIDVLLTEAEGECTTLASHWNVCILFFIIVEREVRNQKKSNFLIQPLLQQFTVAFLFFNYNILIECGTVILNVISLLN